MLPIGHDDKWHDSLCNELNTDKRMNQMTVAGSAPLTPGLPPHKLQAAGGGKVFLDGVVDPLDEHAGQVGPLQQIGHRSAVPKRVYRPPAARSYTCDSRREARRSGLCLDKKGKGCMF